MPSPIQRINGRRVRLLCDVAGAAQASGIIVSHEIVWGSITGNRQNVTYKYTSYIQYEPTLDTAKLVPIGFDAEADALSLYPQKEDQLANQEMSAAYAKVDRLENPDKDPTEYNTQEDFDRQLLGYCMTVEDPHKLNACLPFWQAVQPRNGANASQRAANLGVPLAEYQECEDRFDSYFGVQTFLADDLAAIWPEVKEAWE